MNIDANVKRRSSHHEFADVYLTARDDDGETVGRTRLDVDYRPLLKRCGMPSENAADLLLMAATIYGVDKLIARNASDDAWTRDLKVRVPVADPARWSAARPAFESCVCFLTGDEWTFEFMPRKGSLARPSPKSRTAQRDLADIDAISLFSGGLDSLIGVIDWLEKSPGKLLLLGHHDGDVTGPLSDQRELSAPVASAYPGRVESLLVRVGVSPPGDEISFRSRSLLFLGLALHVAAAARPGIPVLIPENGNIALNVPLTPSRQGSCSTRTAHPHYLTLLREVLARLGIATEIRNPLQAKTKGECVTECRNQDLLKSIYARSVSCAKRGHKKNWVHRDARQCGRCMPCLYRRAALHAAAWDTEQYGADVCAGEVPLDDHVGQTKGPAGAADARAMLAFLHSRPSSREIGRRLAANGRIRVEEMPEAVAIVERAMDEIRALILDKAHPSVQRVAGIRPTRAGVRA